MTALTASVFLRAVFRGFRRGQPFVRLVEDNENDPSGTETDRRFNKYRRQDIVPSAVFFAMTFTYGCLWRLLCGRCR